MYAILPLVETDRKSEGKDSKILKYHLELYETKNKISYFYPLWGVLTRRGKFSNPAGYSLSLT